MLRKLLSVVALAVTLQFIIAEKAVAQKGTSYDNAVGMRLEVGSNYGTQVGVSGKHFFDAHNAGEAQVLFGSGLTTINLEYQYHGDIANAAGLRWVAGAGAGLAFSKKYSAYDYYWESYYYSGGGTDVFIRPVVGLDYKINNVPLNFSFDWRPSFVVTHGTSFNAARFGLGFRYAF
jgi:hypothetical protein